MRSASHGTSIRAAASGASGILRVSDPRERIRACAAVVVCPRCARPFRRRRPPRRPPSRLRRQCAAGSNPRGHRLPRDGGRGACRRPRGLQARREVRRRLLVGPARSSAHGWSSRTTRRWTTSRRGSNSGLEWLSDERAARVTLTGTSAAGLRRHRPGSNRPRPLPYICRTPADRERADDELVRGVPARTSAGPSAVHPELEPEAALDKLWEAVIVRAAGWTSRGSGRGVARADEGHRRRAPTG